MRYYTSPARKGQILADFLAKSPTITDPLEKSITDTPGKNTSPAWTLFIDGAASLEGSGAGVILTDLNGQEVTYALQFNFKTSNNEAKYQALVAGLELTIKMEAQCLEVYTDSLLIVNQVKGLYEAKEELMRRQIEVYMMDALGPEQASYALREAHLRSCDAHAGPKSITQKSTRLGYYWPTIQWVEELPNVLWAHRTTVRAGSGCTPFSLVYGSEVVLPPEIGLPTYRISTFDLTKNDENLRLNLDLLEERRELAALKNARYKTQTERYYNNRVKHNQLKIGDLILRKNEARRQEGQKKLDPNWEGPYQDSSNISLYQSFKVPNEHESGVFITELSHVAEMTLMIKDTTEVTLETNNFLLISDLSGHLPYVGGLDEHVTIDGLSTEAQYLDISGNQAASVGVNRACKKQCTLCSHFNASGSGSSGGFVTVNQSNDAASSVDVGAALGLAHVADAMGPLRWLKRRYESLVVAYQGLQTRILEIYKEKDKVQHNCNELRGMVLARNGDIKLFNEIINHLTKERDELKKQVFELDKEVIRVRMGGR
ncbi:reverse transcriptase domain-containing protein [Tanacetum coccineum]